MKDLSKLLAVAFSLAFVMTALQGPLPQEQLSDITVPGSTSETLA